MTNQPLFVHSWEFPISTLAVTDDVFFEMSQKYMLSTQGGFQNELKLVTLAKIERASWFNVSAHIPGSHHRVIVDSVLKIILVLQMLVLSPGDQPGSHLVNKSK